MNIGKTLDISTRKEWRDWLAKNHQKAAEIWLIYHKKHTGRVRIAYDDAVEEALCFGWIDSIVKGIDQGKYAQRYTPRRQGSPWSQLNKERLSHLIAEGKVAPAGLAAAGKALDESEFVIPADILEQIKKDKITWDNFKNFPPSYQRIRVAFIDGGRNRPEIFKTRLNYFLKMTAQNKQFGTIK